MSTLMSSLDLEQLREVYEAAMSAGLADAREALLMRVDRSVVARVPRASSPAAQISEDLRSLNNAGVIAEWLEAALLLTGLRRERYVFKRALEAVKGRAPSI